MEIVVSFRTIRDWRRKTSSFAGRLLSCRRGIRNWKKSGVCIKIVACSKICGLSLQFNRAMLSCGSQTLGNGSRRLKHSPTFAGRSSALNSPQASISTFVESAVIGISCIHLLQLCDFYTMYLVALYVYTVQRLVHIVLARRCAVDIFNL